MEANHQSASQYLIKWGLLWLDLDWTVDNGLSLGWDIWKGVFCKIWHRSPVTGPKTIHRLPWIPEPYKRSVMVGGPSWYMRRISGQWIMVICGGGLWLVPLSTPSAIYLWKKPFNPWNSYKGGRKCYRSGCSFRAFNHLLSTIEPEKRKQISCQQCSAWIIFRE